MRFCAVLLQHCVREAAMLNPLAAVYIKIEAFKNPTRTKKTHAKRKNTEMLDYVCAGSWPSSNVRAW